MGGQPHWAIISISNKCPLSCRHCFGYGKEKKIDTGKLIKGFETLARAGIRKVTLSGGEPFSRVDLFTIVHYATQIFKTVDMQTSGVGAEPDILNYPITVHFSLDGHVPQLNDYIRNTPGHFERVLKNIILFSKKSRNVGIRTTVTKQLDIKAMIALADTMRVGLTGMRLLPIGGALGLKEMIPEPQDILNVYEEAVKADENGKNVMIMDAQYNIYNPKLRAKSYNFFKKAQGICPALSRRIYVDGITGEIFPCPFLQKKELLLGNLETITPEEIVRKSQELFTLMNKIPLTESCQKCEHKEACMGGCRAIGFPKYRGDDNCPLKIAEVN